MVAAAVASATRAASIAFSRAAFFAAAFFVVAAVFDADAFEAMAVDFFDLERVRFAMSEENTPRTSRQYQTGLRRRLARYQITLTVPEARIVSSRVKRGRSRSRAAAATS